jgi:hypothetical protein
MAPEMAAARKQLLAIADELEAIDFRLRGVQASLPEPAAEAVRLLDVNEMSPATEVRTVVACVRNDWVRSAIRDLRDVVKETEERAKPGEDGE